jgi:hypothetical protein
MSQPTLTISSDFTDKFNETIKRFKRDAILIGIPESDKPRKDGDEISNAALLAINHFGSPKQNIPPRQPMTIGIRNSRDEIAETMKATALAALKSGPRALEVGYARAGFIASNAVKKAINDQDGILPPSDATIKARKYLTKAGFKGEKALLVTGQMRNAITFIVRSIWGQ